MRKNNFFVYFLYVITFLFVSYIFLNLSKSFEPFYEKENVKTKDEDTNVETVPTPYEDYTLAENIVKNDIQGATTNIPKGYVKIPVLMYHQIGAIPNRGSIYHKGLYVTPYMFEKQMKYLVDNNYRTLTPEQFYNYLKTGKTPSRKSVLITFDDGSRGQYIYAYPTLKKYGLTATFYIISQRSPINTSELKRMSNNGMIIDSHSVLHQDLRALNSRSEIKFEVDRSKKQLQYLTGKKIVSIAYPGCVADSAVFNQVASSGYLLGFSCGSSIYHQFRNRLYLSRVHVFSSMYSFTRALTVGL